MEKVLHTIDPVYDENCRILILGSMPSPKSREVGFYYGHPQNRFWRVLGEVLGEEIPESREEKRDLVLRRHIALWDVLAECEIEGASDQSIKNPKINDFDVILSIAQIRAIFATGGKAAQLYKKLRHDNWPVECIRLPSTSAANAAYSLERLVECYRVILPYLEADDDSTA